MPAGDKHVFAGSSNSTGTESDHYSTRAVGRVSSDVHFPRYPHSFVQLPVYVHAGHRRSSRILRFVSVPRGMTNRGRTRKIESLRADQ